MTSAALSAEQLQEIRERDAGYPEQLESVEHSDGDHTMDCNCDGQWAIIQRRVLLRHIDFLTAQPAPSAESEGALASAACDEMSNALQWLKNIRDGVVGTEPAIRDMEAALKRVQALSRPRAEPSAKDVTQVCETCAHLGITPEGWCVDCDWRTNGIKVAHVYRSRLSTVEPSAMERGLTTREHDDVLTAAHVLKDDYPGIAERLRALASRLTPVADAAGAVGP